MTDHGRSVAGLAYAGVRRAFHKHVAAGTFGELRETRKDLEAWQEILSEVLKLAGYEVDGMSAESWYELNLASAEEIV